MEIIPVSLVIVYLIIATCFFRIWFKFFYRDSSLSSEEKRLSWLILLIATFLWFVAVPIAYLELLSKVPKCGVAERRGDLEQSFNS
jgi:Trk-type K+ transport system membrane component